MDGTQYKAMIGSLLYLIGYKPDILFSVFLSAIFQKEPREVHLTAIKGIFRYLIGTPNLNFIYKRRESFRLTSYCDADYAGDRVKRKSRRGSCHFIVGNFITWICKKLGSTALSFAEVEYMPATSCCAQLLWIKSQYYNV